MFLIISVTSCPGEDYFHLVGRNHSPVTVSELWDLMLSLLERKAAHERGLDTGEAVYWRGVFTHRVMGQLRVSILFISPYHRFVVTFQMFPKLYITCRAVLDN
jgi:hypothetical protein